MSSAFRELEPVVLVRDLPDAGLRAGDMGAVVHIYGEQALEVEFVTAAGRTQALLTLNAADVRPVRDDDLLAVRVAGPARGAA
ncbi:MAG: DUF4926 domain-containing protein [Gemmatimonadaceae bacterium]